MSCCGWPWKKSCPSTGRALARTDGFGLEELLRAFGQSFADHARYASLLLQRRTDDATARRIRQAVDELTARAVAAGTVNPGTTTGDVLALVWAMRGLVQASRRGRPRGLAAFPRHPSRRPAGRGAAQRHAAAVLPPAVEAGAAAADPGGQR